MRVKADRIPVGDCEFCQGSGEREIATDAMISCAACAGTGRRISRLSPGDAVRLLDDGRARQESLGYDVEHDAAHSPGDWALILQQEIGQASSAALADREDAFLRAVVKVGSSALACLEAMGAPLGAELAELERALACATFDVRPDEEGETYRAPGHVPWAVFRESLIREHGIRRPLVENFEHLWERVARAGERADTRPGMIECGAGDEGAQPFSFYVA